MKRAKGNDNQAPCQVEAGIRSGCLTAVRGIFRLGCCAAGRDRVPFVPQGRRDDMGVWGASAIEFVET